MLKLNACGLSTVILIGVIPSICKSQTLEVDFGSFLGTHKSMAGFLQGADPVSPPDRMIAPLRVGLWRGSRALNGVSPGAQRAVDMGVRFEENPYFEYWFGMRNGTRPAPQDDNYQQWTAYLNQIMQSEPPLLIAWDVMNEPDDSGFWMGTRQQSFEFYCLTEHIIHQYFPSAMVGGPSTVWYNKSYLTAFLDYAVANGCQVNFLAWHELSGAGPWVASDLQDARASYLQNPAYKTLGLREMHINEMTATGEQYEPAEILAYFYYLEQGGADVAAKSCWYDSTGTNQCGNDSLDGIVTPYYYWKPFQPRAAWWAFKSYADSLDSRFTTNISGTNSIAFSSADYANQKAQVLVGCPVIGGVPCSQNLLINISNPYSVSFLAGAPVFEIQVEQIPDSGEEMVEELPILSTTLISYSPGSPVQINLAGLTPHEVRVITIQAFNPQPNPNK